MSKSITAALRRTYIYLGKAYGPGEQVEIPVGLATTLGISSDGEQEKPASAPGAASTSADGKPLDYAALKVEELEAEATRRGLTVEGSGAGGRVLKADYIEALESADGGAR